MNYVAYYRVSTKKQDLGIPAQKQMVKNYLSDIDTVIKSFQEKESGSKNDRPELSKAIELCRSEGAILLIAKLDRLARDVNFITSLQKSGLEFVALDMPKANKLTIHIMAAMAEHELDMIKERTNAALDQIKRNIERDGYHISKEGNRITSLGGSKVPTDADREKAKRVLKKKRESNENNQRALSVVCLLKEKGEKDSSDKMTLQQMADHLNRNGYKTSRGKSFSSIQVSRLLKLCNETA
ncbi:hypothetical protein LCGC14_1210750 [marine sediment metagenome]|uniref:Recombinase family protein n=2 Tax=root TaxID=1 RepID=A0A831QMV8_9FLAO|nr:recombinase family protein [Pricia sp.]HEA19626.1 recombinase family protein [Pricia antarctica]